MLDGVRGVIALASAAFEGIEIIDGGAPEVRMASAAASSIAATASAVSGR